MSDIGNERFVAIAMAAMLAVGCGGGDGGGESSTGDGGEATPAASPVDAATAGNVSGMVMFDGAAPEMPVIDISEEQACADKHTSPPTSQEVVVGDGGGLGNVFVYVSQGLESLEFPTPSESVLMDQDGCIYIPHVLGVMASQDITVRNSDGLLHNINASPDVNRGFNFGQPTNMESTRSFPTPEVMIPVRCDVHGWMSAFIGVTDHPYYAVTAEDGSFSLETLPPGDYTITAWHERYGTQDATVTVATGETGQVSFTFSEDMAGRTVPMGEPVDLHDHAPTAVAEGQ